MKQLGVALMVLAIWVCLPVQTPFAQSSAVWQTTFNCAEWDQSMGIGAGNVNCDGLAGYGSWATSQHPKGDQITLAANNPAGGGGRGFRHWRGDGINNNGGGIAFNLPTTLREMWMRFYMRYQAGFNWTPSGTPNYTKDIYFHSTPVFTLGFHSGNSWGVSIISPGANWYGSPGWQSVMGGSTSDGQWHCYEVHTRMDTNGSNGVAENWIDNVLVHSNSNVNWGTSGGFQNAEIGDNQSTVSNGTEMYTDYDDFVVSNSGRIGCLGSVTVLPAAPTNVRVVR